MTPIKVQAVVEQVGDDIRTAHKRRRIAARDFADSIGVSDKILHKLARGDGGVRMETFAMALLTLGELNKLRELLAPASDDLGQNLDKALLAKRIPRKCGPKPPVPRTDAIDGEGVGF